MFCMIGVSRASVLVKFSIKLPLERVLKFLMKWAPTTRKFTPTEAPLAYTGQELELLEPEACVSGLLPVLSSIGGQTWKGHQSLAQLDDSSSIYQLSDVFGRTRAYLTGEWLKFNNRDFIIDSMKEFKKRLVEIQRKEIKRPEALDIKEFAALHEGIALQNLNQFYHVSFRQGDRTFTSQAWDRDSIVDLDNVDTMVFQLGSVAGRHSRKEKVTMDDLYKKKSPIVEAHLIGRIARLFGMMTPGALRGVTLGPKTSLLSVAKLVELAPEKLLAYLNLVNTSLKKLQIQIFDMLAPLSGNTPVYSGMNNAEIETISTEDFTTTSKFTSSTNDVNTAKPAYEVSNCSPNVNTNERARPQSQFMKKSRSQKVFEEQHSPLSKGKEVLSNDRECRAPRNKEGQFRNQDNTRKHGNNKDTSSKAMLAIDGVAATYKRGLATIEEQLITYRKNEVLFSEEVVVLKRKVACKDYEINVLKSEFEKITDKSKKGLGYNDVPPPHPLIYKRPKKLDLSYSGLDEFKETEFKSYGSEDSKKDSNIICDKKSDDSKENSNDSLVKEQVPEDTSSFVESSLNVDKETIFLDKKIEFVKPKNHEKPVKKLVRYVNTSMRHYHTERPRAGNTARSYIELVNAVRARRGKPLMDDKGFVDSGCLRYMTGNIAYLLDFKKFDGGYVTFGGGAHGGRIFSKRTLKTNSLDFEDVYFVNELKFNLFSVSQMCDKKNYVLFTNTECLVLSLNFKLPDETRILLKIPKKDNMYSFDIKNIVPKESLTCLLVKDNLVRGLPTKRFENDQTCVTCLKGKQYRASCKSKVLNLITKPLFMLHMDLFGPTFVSSLMHKKYCLVVTDDYSRFTWVFFLATKEETSEILNNFIKEIENLVDKKVKIIWCDNGTEFKNKVMDDFFKEKGIRREYNVARTPQQNGVAERRNMTLIEAARTMLADSKLATTFWDEAVSTACYVQNRVLVVKPHNKIPYELFRGSGYQQKDRKPSQNDKTEHGMEKTVQNQGQSPKMPKSESIQKNQQSNRSRN
ncbi:putative ribonuclease H-like domain-containing protein [Tanacetum coccineum]